MSYESRPADPATPPSTRQTAGPRRRLMVIFNPTAGGAKGRRLRRTLDALRGHGCTLDLRATKRKGDAEAFAASASADTVDAVVVAGGDGTINEAVNGLAAISGTPPPLGIIPLGTANVLALEIGQSLRPQAIADTLVHGPQQSCALARIMPPSDGHGDTPQTGRLFLLMGGAGFDAHVVENVKLGLKRHTGKLAYVWETLVQALRYPFPPVRGRADGIPFEAATAVVCNGRFYGGPFVAAPVGDLSARTLYLVLLKRQGLGNVLRYAIALATGHLASLPDVTILPARDIQIDRPAGEPLQADGDTICHLPVRITVAPSTLDLIVPT